MIALVESYKAGLLAPKHWGKNVIAGLIVGIVALPLSMAFAIASGVKPEQGIYTAILAGIIVGVFGGTRTQISGPTGAFIVILAGITAKYGFNGLQLTTILAGVFLCAMGLLKIGDAIKFIPRPVVIGFTSGIAVIIFVGQWKDFLGLQCTIPIDVSFFQRIILLVPEIPNFHTGTTLIALLSLFILTVGTRVLKKIPAALVVMILATLLQYVFDVPGVTTIGSIYGEIPQKFPGITFPTIDMNELPNLIGSAFAIALLGAIESLLSATAADALTGTRHDSNQELIGQGLANFIAPFFGGFASTGAFARTVTNIRNGGNSVIASLVHAGVLILVMAIFAPYAKHIPLAALAAILVVVAFNMSDLPEFTHVLKNAPWYDIIVMLVTFGFTIFTDLVTAVMIGVILAMLLFMVRLQQTLEIKHSHHTLRPRSTESLDAHFLAQGIIYEIGVPFFFGVSERIEQALAIAHDSPRFIILRLVGVPFIDLTGLTVLSRLITTHTKRGIRVYICEANEQVSKKLSKIGILKTLEGEQVFSSLVSVEKHYESHT